MLCVGHPPDLAGTSTACWRMAGASRRGWTLIHDCMGASCVWPPHAVAGCIRGTGEIEDAQVCTLCGLHLTYVRGHDPEASANMAKKQVRRFFASLSCPWTWMLRGNRRVTLIDTALIHKFTFILDTTLLTTLFLSDCTLSPAVSHASRTTDA